MYAVKCVNLCNNPATVYHYKAHDYVDACEIRRRVEREIGDAWEYGTDYTLEIVEVEDDFDFENQPEWN